MSSARSRQLAYFKDNIQSQDDQDEFDASRYYYNREDQGLTGTNCAPTLGLPASAISSMQSTLTAPVHVAAQNPMTFTPSSDLLAMLSLGSTDASQTSQSLPDGVEESNTTTRSHIRR